MCTNYSTYIVLIEAETLNNSVLSLSASSGSLLAPQNIFVRGPCLKSSDTVSLRWRPQSGNGPTFDINGTVINSATSSFPQPFLPKALPGRYFLSLVINSAELVSAASTSFLLSTDLLTTNTVLYFKEKNTVNK